MNPVKALLTIKVSLTPWSSVWVKSGFTLRFDSLWATQIFLGPIEQMEEFGCFIGMFLPWYNYFTDPTHTTFQILTTIPISFMDSLSCLMSPFRNSVDESWTCSLTQPSGMCSLMLTPWPTTICMWWRIVGRRENRWPGLVASNKQRTQFIDRAGCQWGRGRGVSGGEGEAFIRESSAELWVRKSRS